MDSVKETGHPIAMRVTEIRGRGIGPTGTEAADVFRPDREIGAVCHWAAHTRLPFTMALRFGGDLASELEPGPAGLCRPDSDNSRVFEIRRLKADG